MPKPKNMMTLLPKMTEDDRALIGYAYWYNGAVRRDRNQRLMLSATSPLGLIDLALCKRTDVLIVLDDLLQNSFWGREKEQDIIDLIAKIKGEA